MIKLTPKFNNLKNFAKIQSNKTLPEVRKPILSYMPLEFKEPDYRNLDTDDSLFGLIYKYAKYKVKEYQLKNTSYEEKETQTTSNYVTETKSELVTQTRNQIQETEKYRYEDDMEDDEDEDEYIYKEPVYKKVFKAIATVIMFPIEKFQDWTFNLKYKKQQKERRKYEINTMLANKAMYNKEIRNFLGEKTMEKLIRSQLSIKKVEKLINKTIQIEQIQRQKELEQIRELNELNELRNKFQRRLYEYKRLFDKDDMLPDMSEFENYTGLNLVSLQKLYKTLEQRIEHQYGINNLKQLFKLGMSYYIPNIGGRAGSDNSKVSSLRKISPNYNKKGSQYREELMRLCKLYLKNSKIIEPKIEEFNSTTKNFLDTAKSNIEKIYELKKDPKFKITEKVPYIGIVPKAVRFVDNINLTRCILKDFEEITKKYIQQGTHIDITEYGKQFNKIVKYAKSQNLSEEDKKYTEAILRLVQKAKTTRMETYTKVYKNFTDGGKAIRNICYNIRIKDAVGMTMKTVKLLSLLG